MKKNDYFIALYDLDDNYIRDFNSINDCALYFKTTRKTISDYIFRKKKLKNTYQLFKIEECSPAIQDNKSL